MTDEFRYTCANGHSFISSNKIRAFCPDCGKNTRRVQDSKEPDKPVDESTTNKKGITIKHVVPKTKERPKSLPQKEPIQVPTKKATSHTSRTTTSTNTKRPTSSQKRTAPANSPTKSATPLAHKRVAGKRAVPPVAKKMPRTTKQANKIAENETMFTRMRRHAFGR